MKKQFILLTAILAVLLQGCIVKSLHPFFEENDVVFKAGFLDSWIDQDSNKWEITQVKYKPNAYQMTCVSDGMEASFIAHLFELEGALYLDFLPLSSSMDGIDIFELHLLPSHSVARVMIINDEEVLIKWFNEEWLSTLFKQNRIKIAHEVILDEQPKDEDDKTFVLTASTEELQKFLIKYGNEDAAFVNDNTVWLKLKRSI